MKYVKIDKRLGEMFIYNFDISNERTAKLFSLLTALSSALLPLASFSLASRNSGKVQA